MSGKYVCMFVQNFPIFYYFNMQTLDNGQHFVIPL